MLLIQIIAAAIGDTITTNGNDDKINVKTK